VGGGQAVTNVPSNLENPASGMDVVEAIFVGRDGAAGAMAATPLTDHASGDMTASVSGGDQGLPGSVGFVIVIGGAVGGAGGCAAAESPPSAPILAWSRPRRRRRRPPPSFRHSALHLFPPQRALTPRAQKTTQAAAAWRLPRAGP